jgi:DNA-binding SARP family transcriptional activator
MQIERLLSAGNAAAYDASELAFDSREVAEMARAYGVAFDDMDLAQTIYDTEGWPIAVEWLIREAAETRRHLRDAFGHWRDRNGHLLLELVENDHRDDPASYDSFKSLLAAAPGEQRSEMERLLQDGLPLTRTRAGARPYRILRRLAAAVRGIAAERVSRPLPPVLMLNVLGQFRCEIAGKPVAFSRRRDQSVFVFVALAQDGRCLRETVLDAFWSGVDHPVAAQGLRTTISRIRHALSEAAPGVEPELYFQSESDLRVDWSNVALDARRFVELVEQGRADDALGIHESARRHYRLAYSTYRSDLLASEALEPCFEPIAGRLHDFYVETLRRLLQLSAAAGDLETARSYERELATIERTTVSSAPLRT